MKKKSKMKVDDVGKESKSRLQSAVSVNPTSRQAFFEKNTPRNVDDPTSWVNEHIDKQQIQSALELEYQLKFGDDKTRKELALEFLGFRGITKKQDTNGQVVPAIQVIMSGAAPWTQVSIESGKKPELVEGEVVETKTK